MNIRQAAARGEAIPDSWALDQDGKPTTEFLHFGDRVRIEMLDAQGASIFGAIDQTVRQIAAAG